MRLVSAAVFVIATVAIFAALVAFPRAARASHRASTSSSKLMSEAEEQMVGNGELDSLQGAYWALQQGPKIIPILAAMLTKQKYYDKKYDYAVGAFPFNALWALSHLKTPAAREALQHYYAQSKDKEALLAIKGWETRAKYGNSSGVLVNNHDLLASTSEKSKVIAHLRAGEPIQTLKSMIENDKEEDARGGPTEYDQVRVIRTKQVGYIERASDDFDPTY